MNVTFHHISQTTTFPSIILCTSTSRVVSKCVTHLMNADVIDMNALFTCKVPNTTRFKKYCIKNKAVATPTKMLMAGLIKSFKLVIFTFLAGIFPLTHKKLQFNRVPITLKKILMPFCDGIGHIHKPKQRSFLKVGSKYFNFHPLV